MLAGWSSGSKYPLLGSVRASAQMVSYEAALGLSVVAVVLLAGSLSTHDIVMSQAGDGLRRHHPAVELIVTGVVPFVIFVIAGTAELNRPPFDLVEAEQELVGGFHTEYCSIRFALFFLAEFMNTVTMSAIIVTLFLGGPAGPTFFGPDWIWGPVWFLAKLFDLPVHVRVAPGHAARASATTSSWTSAGRSSSRCRSGGCSCWPASTSPATATGTPGVVVAVGFAAIVVVVPAPHRAPSAPPAAPSRAGRRGGVHLMGYLEGFRVTFGKLFKGTRDRAHRHGSRT